MSAPLTLDWQTMEGPHVRADTMAAHFRVRNPAGDWVNVRVSDEFLEDYAAKHGGEAAGSKEEQFAFAIERIREVTEKLHREDAIAEFHLVTSDDV